MSSKIGRPVRTTSRNRLPGITLSQALPIAFHPHDIGVAVDNHRALARLLDNLEQ
jgi:hypothetical protein